MEPFPESEKLKQRLTERLDTLATSFTGEVYRFIDPQYTSPHDQFAGKGAQFSHSRWFLRGNHRITYCSLQPETALAEALAAGRYFGFPDSQTAPIVLVTARVDLGQIIPFTKGSVRQRLRLSEETIVESDWRRENHAGREAITQAWGRALYQTGIEGFLVPSSAWKAGTNLIFFPQQLRAQSSLDIKSEVEWPRPQ